MFFFNNTQKNVKLNLALVVVLFQRRNEENGSKLNQEIGKGGVGPSTCNSLTHPCPLKSSR